MLSTRCTGENGDSTQSRESYEMGLKKVSTISWVGKVRNLLALPEKANKHFQIMIIATVTNKNTERKTRKFKTGPNSLELFGNLVISI